MLGITDRYTTSVWKTLPCIHGTRCTILPMFAGWGNGYAAFTYCERDKEMIRHYIMNQKEHHRVHTFREEYESLLAEWGIDPATDFFLRDE